MKAATPRRRIKSGFVGAIADQVVAFLIFKDAPETSAQVVCVVNEHPAGLLGQVIEPVLRFEVEAAAVAQDALKLIERVTRSVVSRRQAERLQAARVHRVDDDRRTIGEVSQTAQSFEDAVAAPTAIEDRETFGKQHDRFAPRQIPETAHDIVERAERADGEKLFTKLVDLIFGAQTIRIISTAPAWFFRLRRGERPERADAVAPDQSAAHAFDGRVELSLIGGELLQRADACGRAQNGYQIARLHLLVHKFSQRAAHHIRAFKRDAEIVHDERDGAAHLLRAQPNRRREAGILIRR
jgi:hypothetical protein